MDSRNSKEVIINIESGEEAIASGKNKWGKKSLNRLFSGVLCFNGEANMESDSNETTKLLVNEKNPGGAQQMPVKANNKILAPKPPRPPKGPSLDAADMRLIKELSRLAMKKRERIERIKTLKKMKAARLASSSSSSSSAGGTLPALVITLLFFLVLIFQGMGCSNSSKSMHMGAPQPAQETKTGLTPLEFYKTVLSDDGAAPTFVHPRSTEQHLSRSEFTSPG